MVKHNNVKKCFLPRDLKPSSQLIRLNEDVLKTSFVFDFRRRLQDVLIKKNIFVLVICLQYMLKTFSRRLQDVSKTSSRRLQDYLPRRLKNIFKMPCKNVFKTSSRCLQDVFKTSSKRLQDILQKCLQDIFKTSSRGFGDVIKTFSGRIIKLNYSC